MISIMTKFSEYLFLHLFKQIIFFSNTFWSMDWVKLEEKGIDFELREDTQLKALVNYKRKI